MFKILPEQTKCYFKKGNLKLFFSSKFFKKIFTCSDSPGKAARTPTHHCINFFFTRWATYLNKVKLNYMQTVFILKLAWNNPKLNKKRIKSNGESFSPNFTIELLVHNQEHADSTLHICIG